MPKTFEEKLSKIKWKNLTELEHYFNQPNRKLITHEFEGLTDVMCFMQDGLQSTVMWFVPRRTFWRKKLYYKLIEILPY